MFRPIAAIGFSLAMIILTGPFLNGAGAADKKKTPPPLRVLLFAGGPTREYQLLRALLVRETERKRVELSIHLQPSSSKAKRSGVLQDVPAERQLEAFPTKLEAYDALVAFDPDWTRLSDEMQSALQKWVEKGGILILLAGPIHTRQLNRRDNADKLKAILKLYPVVLDDIRKTDIDTSKPRRLHFSANPEKWPFLKLDAKASAPLAGWEEFFTGRKTGDAKGDGEVERGFFSYYPVRGVKDDAVVLATLADVKARLKDGKEQPYLVALSPGKGRVLYLSSGEIWRLRTYKPAYYERMWLEMLSVGDGEPTSRKR
jgi:hypothetical protein